MDELIQLEKTEGERILGACSCLIEDNIKMVFSVGRLRTVFTWHRIGINIMFLDIICRLVYISKYDVSETGFCLRLQVNPNQMGPIDRASPYLGRQNPLSETLSFKI
jgi:hypothetical protein